MKFVMAPKQAAPKKKRTSGARTTQKQKDEQAKKKKEKRRAEKEARLRTAGETTCRDKPRQTAKKKKKASGTRTAQEQREARLLRVNMARRAGKEMRKTMDDATVIPQEAFFERRHETIQKRPKEMRLWLPHTLKTLGFCTVYSDVCASLAQQIRLGEQIGQMKRGHAEEAEEAEAAEVDADSCLCVCGVPAKCWCALCGQGLCMGQCGTMVDEVPHCEGCEPSASSEEGDEQNVGPPSEDKATEAMHTSTPQCYCGCNKEGCFLV